MFWFVFGVLLTVGLCVDVPITKHWNGGFQGTACVTITKELHTWRAHLTFSEPIDTLEIWKATATKTNGGREFVLTNMAWNADEHVGDQLCLDFVARKTGDSPPQVSFRVEGVSGGATGSHHTNNQHTNHHQTNNHHTSQPAATTSAPHTGGGTARYDYSQAMTKSILFYDAQRSGKLPANNPIHWRGDSALTDRGDHGEDLTGGWYDAGDHVKFNFPMASSTTLLLWGYYRWKDAYTSAHQTNQFFDMIKWPLDYFLKCWTPSSQTLYAQVGNGNTDHSYWGRPEQMTMSRPAYKLTPSKPGSDLAGEMAASLALGYLVFKDRDATYANKLKTAAIEIYKFGKAHPGIYSQSVSNAAQFYSSSSYKDEMCEGAMWLYRATRDQSYLTDAKSFHENAWAWALSWDDKKIACQMLLYEETKSSQYRQEVEGFFKGWLPGGSITYTPCGQAWRDKWGSNRYAANSAFAALMAADDGIQTATLRKWAEGQINYLLGDNKYGISFEIGFGSKYPRNPHHRGASCPNMPAHCSDAQLHASGPSPHLLVGALVGGPDAQDNYRDNREDYVQNEVACDYNSGFQSALAGLTHLIHSHNLPGLPAPKCHG